MIIIKTNNGDAFINEKAFQLVIHIKDQQTVRAFHDTAQPPVVIENVEAVLRVSDTNHNDYKDMGSAVESLIRQNKEKAGLIYRLDEKIDAIQKDLLHFAHMVSEQPAIYAGQLPEELKNFMLKEGLRLKNKVLDHEYNVNKKEINDQLTDH